MVSEVRNLTKLNEIHYLKTQTWPFLSQILETYLPFEMKNTVVHLEYLLQTKYHLDEGLKLL